MLTILYIEDEPYDVELFAIAMRHVHAAAALRSVPDLAEAIDYLEGSKAYTDRRQYPMPDLVVLDSTLCGRPGMDFLRWREGSPFQDLPVVFLTSSERQGELQEALALGALMTVPKLCDIHKFRAVVEQLCQLEVRDCARR